MEQLPNELVRHIRSFVYPFNWRTCKKQEASLVKCLDKSLREAIWLDSEEKEYWTMFGLWFLLYLPREIHHAPRRPPLIPPSEQYYREDYHGWYIHRIQWNNQ